MSPFIDELLQIQNLINSTTLSLQIGFFFGLTIACISYLISVAYILVEFKNAVMILRSGNEILKKKIGFGNKCK